MLVLVLLLLCWRRLWHWRSLLELRRPVAIGLCSTGCGGTRRYVRGRFRTMIPSYRARLCPLLLSIVTLPAIRSRHILRHRLGSIWGREALLRRSRSTRMYPLRRRTLTPPISLVMPRVMSLHVLLAASAHRWSSVLWRTRMTTTSALLRSPLARVIMSQIHQGHGFVHRSGLRVWFGLLRGKRWERVVLGAVHGRCGRHERALSSYVLLATIYLKHCLDLRPIVVRRASRHTRWY
jgi:hypothetical protein